MVRVLHEEMRCGGVVTGRAGDEGVCLLPLPGVVTSQWKVPPRHIHGRVVPEVLDVAPALQNQGLQPFFAQFLGRPAARDATADYNRVILDVVHHDPTRDRSVFGPWCGTAGQPFGRYARIGTLRKSL